MNLNNNKPNKLILEKSPYLLQHAYNPVNWFAWNDEALNISRKEDKPIFLSVGYSTCYWCHVMKRECFENEEIAKLLNTHFICIKVDREERTDIDRIYMTALQSMTGSGGWPMSIFLTPDLKPFYGATYIPPKAKYGRAGFEDILITINNLWASKKNEIIDSSNKISEILNLRLNKSNRKVSDDIFQKCFEQCNSLFDYENGGFGNGNKFPRTVVFDFLLAFFNETKKTEALDIVSFSLKKMCEGGIYDHIGGGFHRYSVDQYWRVPHFEKMLYDQVLISSTLISLYQITNDKFFLEFAENTLNYVKGNLMGSEGGFFSAEDAESAVSTSSENIKEEGFYYLWTASEIDDIIEKKDSDIFKFYYGIRFEGNTISDPHNVFRDRNVIYLASDIFETSKHFNLTTGEIESSLNSSYKLINEFRSKRPKPVKDIKILTNWNSLMISAFCKAYQVTKYENWLNIADGATNFILNNLFDKQKNLLYHCYIDGKVKIEGSLIDYAYFIKALIDLYESSFDIKYIDYALMLNKLTIEKFYDKSDNGFFDNDVNAKDLFLFTKESYDGSEPSGNSIMIENLYRLGHLTNNNDLIELANKSIEYFYDIVYNAPFQSPMLIFNIYHYLKAQAHIIVSGNMRSKDTKDLIDVIHKKYLPLKTLMYANPKIEHYSTFLKNIVQDFEKTKVYICENFKCNLPIDNIIELKNILR
jgi:uncharacterized protein